MKNCPLCGAHGSQIFIHFECSRPGCPNSPGGLDKALKSFSNIERALEYVLGEVYQLGKQILWLAHDTDLVNKTILQHPSRQLHFLPFTQSFTSAVGTLVQVRPVSVTPMTQMGWDVVLHTQKSEFTIAGPHSEMYDWVREVTA